MKNKLPAHKLLPVDTSLVFADVHDALMNREVLDKTIRDMEHSVESGYNVSIRVSLDLPVFTWGASVLAGSNSSVKINRMEFYGFHKHTQLIEALQGWLKNEMVVWVQASEESMYTSRKE